MANLSRRVNREIVAEDRLLLDGVECHLVDGRNPYLIPASDRTLGLTPDWCRDLEGLSWLDRRRAKRYQSRLRGAGNQAVKNWESEVAAVENFDSGVPRGGPIGPGHRYGGRPRYWPIMSGHLFTAPTTQIAGMFPLTQGGGSPSVGVPLGRNIITGDTVCFSVHSWHQHGLLTAPNLAVFGQPGVGKSGLGKRIIIGEVAFGTLPIIMGDVKLDYVELIRALDGQVIELGKGRDVINPLDGGPIAAAVAQLRAAGFTEDARLLEIDGHERRRTLLFSLAEVGKGTPLNIAEKTILSSVVSQFAEKATVDPLVGDVVRYLREPTEYMIEQCGYRNEAQFADAALPLIQILQAMLIGELSNVFDSHTTNPIDLDAPAIEFDISAIASGGGGPRTAAAMLAVWSYTMSTIDADLALSNAGLKRHRNYLGVIDELWNAIQGSPALVQRASEAVRVGRHRGFGLMLTTHSVADYASSNEAGDRSRSEGIIERCGVVIIGGVPNNEIDRLEGVMNATLNNAERDLIASWSTSNEEQLGARHPGIGNFLIKSGNGRGIPLNISLTQKEHELFQTNRVASWAGNS